MCLVAGELGSLWFVVLAEQLCFGLSVCGCLKWSQVKVSWWMLVVQQLSSRSSSRGLSISCFKVLVLVGLLLVVDL